MCRFKLEGNGVPLYDIRESVQIMPRDPLSILKRVYTCIGVFRESLYPYDCFLEALHPYESLEMGSREPLEDSGLKSLTFGVV